MGIFGFGNGQGKPCAGCREASEKADRALARVKDQALAFEELQDKCYRWMQRSRKREAADEAATDGAAPTPTTVARARVLAGRVLTRGISPGLPGGR